MKPLSLPPGLEDQNLELYSFNSEPMAIFNGHKTSFWNLPAEIIQVFRDDLASFPKAIKEMAHMNLFSDKEMLTMWVLCNYGNFNNEPDFDYTLSETHKEYFDCGKRGMCSGEGKICQALKVENGVITKREIDIIKLIAEGILNKEIADRLGISITTVPVHIQHISEKMGLKTRTEIASFAFKKGII